MSDDFFNEENIPKTNWMSFKTIGDTVKGTYLGQSFKEGQNNMPDQEVIEITNVEVNGVKQDGNYNVPIKASNSYILNRIKNVRVGQLIGFKYVADIEPKVKGNHPAKSITPYVGGMDPVYKIAEESGGTVVDSMPF